MTGMIPIAELEGMQPKTGTAYGYARVSTIEQADHGDSVEGQKQRIYEYYLARLKPMGISWGGFFVDPGVSAFKVEWQRRPAGRQLLSKLKRDDHVITDRVDRMCRSAPNMFSIIQFARDEDLKFHFLDANLDPTTPMGEMIIGVIAILSQLDSSLKSKRLKEAYSHRIRTGNRINNEAGKKGTRKTVATMSKSILGLRMVQKDTKIDYYIHWRLWSAAKLIADNPEFQEYARRSIIWLDAKREKKPFKLSVFSEEGLMFSHQALISVQNRWHRYIKPFLSLAPTLPYPPEKAKQDKDTLWATAYLDNKGRIKRWKMAYQPVHDDHFGYRLVDPGLIYKKIHTSTVDHYGRGTGKTKTDLQGESNAPSNKSSHKGRVRRRLVPARRPRGIVRESQERD